jgi:ABC-type nitrate/sulfonate/bicarbonate transport system permease component
MTSAEASVPQAPAHHAWWVRVPLARILGLLLIPVLLVLWQLSVRQRWIVSDSWPAVTDVLRAGIQGIASGELLLVLGSTLARAGIGYACGVLAGAGLGLAFAMSSMARRLLSPMVEILRPIPVPALVPPLVLLLGVNDPMKITVVALTVVFPVLTNTVQGVQAVDNMFIAVARTFHVGPAATTLKIIFPAALPFLLAGMRISLALALIVAVVAEMIAGSQGIGHYLMLMQYAVRPQDMYAAIFLLALSGYLLNKIFMLLEERLIHWYFQVENRREVT